MSSPPRTQTSPVLSPDEIEQRFSELVATWEQAVAHQSSSTVRQRHPAYQAIIALGQAVVPLLLRDLEVNRRHWFAALAAITGADPVASEHAGQIDAMAEDWLAWARRQGYQW
jgi:hypothetical protein